jgi:hypothetical protein
VSRNPPSISKGKSASNKEVQTKFSLETSESEADERYLS